MTLDELMVKYGTDKGSTEHNYGPIYEEHFDRLRAKEITLLELGIWKGASLQAWRAYFPAATIIGLDRNKVPEIKGMRIERQIVGDQDDPQLIKALGEALGPFDIVIDDASHISSKTIASFKLLWPFVAPGGIYVIEDLQTSYDPNNYHHSEASRNPEVPPWSAGRHNPRTAMQWCKHLADEVNRGLYPDQFWDGYGVARVTFGCNICFITKVS